MPGKIQLHSIRELLIAAEKRLRPKRIRCAGDEDEGWLDAEILLAHTLNKDRSWIIAHGNDCLSPYLESCFLKYVARREQREPIAYITKQKQFYGRDFFVNAHVLIPRPETELIIDELKLSFGTNDQFLLIDIGTGSGVIAVTVAKEFPRCRVIASDISSAALSVAKKNAVLHRAAKRIKMIRGNLICPAMIRAIGETRLPIVIAANLPYLPIKNRKTLDSDVVDYEPDEALFSGKDGLDAIRQLCDDLVTKLNVLPNIILCEFDAPQAKTILKLAQETFPTMHANIVKDLAQRDRLLKIKK